MAAQQRITASEARARMLLENAANWSRGTAITAAGETVGVVLFASGSRPGIVYLTRCDGLGCDCPGSVRYLDCCHMRACRMEAEQARGAAARKPRVGLSDIWPTCQAKGCDSDPEPRSAYCYRHQLVDAF